MGVPVPLTLSIVLTALLYLRGWLGLRSASANFIPTWRVGSFFLGLSLIWIAVGSPVAVFDEELLTAHMVQHLLLMTLDPPLILLGAPVMALLHGLPQPFVQLVVGPLLRLPVVQRLGRFARATVILLACFRGGAGLVAYSGRVHARVAFGNLARGGARVFPRGRPFFLVACRLSLAVRFNMAAMAASLVPLSRNVAV